MSFYPSIHLPTHPPTSSHLPTSAGAPPAACSLSRLPPRRGKLSSESGPSAFSPSFTRVPPRSLPPADECRRSLQTAPLSSVCSPSFSSSSFSARLTFPAARQSRALRLSLQTEGRGQLVAGSRPRLRQNGSSASSMCVCSSVGLPRRLGRLCDASIPSSMTKCSALDDRILKWAVV